MKKILLSLTSLCLVFGIYAQESAKKAKIVIKKSENGEVSTFEEEIPIEEGEDLEKILNDMGIWEDFEDLNIGETIELNVRRFDQGNWENALELAISGNENPRAFLGVMISNLEEESEIQGVKITEIIIETAAAESGLQSGDIITKIDDTPTNTVKALIEAIDAKAPGEKVQVHYIRDGKSKKEKIELGKKKRESFKMNHLGDQNVFMFNDEEVEFDFPRELEVELEELHNIELLLDDEMNWLEENSVEKAFLGVTPSSSQSESGVLIGTVIKESSASKMGIESGDIVKSFAGIEVNSFEELAEQIGSKSPGENVEIEVVRGNESITISGELGSRNFGKAENVHFFKEFKGMDENGDVIYDFEIDLDEEDLKEREEVIRMMIIDQKEELEQLRNTFKENIKEVAITIEIDNISPEEAAAVNKKAELPLKTDNDLEMDNFSFFPNPSSGEFNLKFDLPESGNVQVMVYDQTGGIVYNERINGFSGVYNNVVDLSMYADGVYYLQVIQNNKTYSKKLIKG